MPLLRTLRAEAQRRGLIAASDDLDAARAFELVRDMPYARASGRDPETTIREWRGTCSGKHYLLKALLEELGHNVTIIACTHQFTVENSPWLPPELRAMVEDHPVPDVHQFLRVESHDGEWMTVDATWPLAARSLGLPANERWTARRDMRVAADPDELFHTPHDARSPEAAQTFKERLIEREIGDQASRRDHFIEALSRWLEHSLESAPGRSHSAEDAAPR